MVPHEFICNLQQESHQEAVDTEITLPENSVDVIHVAIGWLASYGHSLADSQLHRKVEKSPVPRQHEEEWHPYSS